MKRQRGNILFLILLAVVLFAALSYAVTQSTQGGGKNASSEKVSAQASELLNYYAALDAGIQRMMLTGGLKDYELNFYYQTYHKYVYGSNDNGNCTENRCRVFDPAGGGVIGKELDPFTRGDYPDPERLLYVSVPNVGTTAPDIVLGYHNAQIPLCKEINKAAGISDIIYSTAGVTTSSTIMYQYAPPLGAMPAATVTQTNIPANAAIAGTYCACTQTTEALCISTLNQPMIFHVLVAR